MQRVLVVIVFGMKGLIKMNDNIIAKNRFCDITKVKFRKWDEIDVLYWKLRCNDARSKNGEYYSNAYKDAYVQYNRTKIINHADAKGIPPDLLGGIAWIEVGGKPESYKIYTFETRRMMSPFHVSKHPLKTSFGSVAMQLGVAINTLGLDPETLTVRDQLELSNCLLEDDFNLNLVATHLQNLILFDYPDCATMYLTDEQYLMAGVRYNRGTERKLKDFIKARTDNPTYPSDEYKLISYGLRLLQIRLHIKWLLGL